jgi:hypothetical protein
MNIKTNNQQRPIIYWHDLPESAKDEYENISDTGSSFFKYKGQYYAFDEFSGCKDGGPFDGWHGYMSDTAFSGIVVRYSDDWDNDSVIVGYFYG